LKTAFAGVPPQLISEYGAVSPEVAQAWPTASAPHRAPSAWASPNRGPTGGTEEKPVGLVHIAISDTRKTESIERRFRGDATASGSGLATGAGLSPRWLR